jgi:6-phosphogluconolactonase
MAQVHMIEEADDRAVADWLELRLSKALSQGPAAIAVPGGSTPFPILAELATRDLDWNKLSVWPTDDRIVPADHPASNIGRIAAILAPAGAHCLALEESARPPHFSLIWLGMGADGHVASLFPSADPRIDDGRRVRRLTPDPLPPEAPFDRLSLTFPALLDNDEVRGSRPGRKRLAGRAPAGRRQPAGDMLRLIPAPAFRLALRAAHRVRLQWWRLRKPRLAGCRVLAFDAEERLLLVRHSYGSGKWMPPGGGLGRGEDALAAAARELLEETACRLEQAALIALSSEQVGHASNEVHVVGGITMDVPCPDGREIIEARFFELHLLPQNMPRQFAERLPEWAKAAKAARRPDAAAPPPPLPARTG